MTAPDERNGPAPAAADAIDAIDAIVIGTSAGGIDALSRLLPAIAPGFAGAVFVVLHLPPGRPSLLVDIFAPRCALRVKEADDKEPVAPATLYFAPPDYHLLLDAGPQLALSIDPPENYSRPSIDVLFESAADVYGPRLLGALLTGASRDGAAGIEAVRRAGGLSVVQDPGSAHSPLMVEAALERCAAHRVLPLDGIAALLAQVTAAPARRRTPAEAR